MPVFILQSLENNLYNSDTTGSATIAGESKDFGSWNQRPKAIRKAWAILSKITNDTVKQQTEEVLYIIGRIIEVVQEVTGGQGRIPPLHAHLLDDGSVVVEWIVSDFRIGFNIELNPEESGWHYITSKKMGERTASGPLDDKKVIIRLLVDTLIKSI